MERINLSQFPILDALKAWDEYTYLHSVNVYQLALLLGIEAKYSDEQLRQLGYGALLHDIGKLFVPQEILTKPGSLDSQEILVVRQHPEKGYEISPPLPSASKAIILQHHENWDGSGYPRGLSDKAIHPFARIVTIADVYDALVSHRVYAPPWSGDDALGYIKKLAGIKFDPDVVACWTKTTYK
ncbi:cyclic di-GMP phosphodiesterase response regulator RpfG [Peptococcaceae bacterium CEB3]|nr:cyclic di-GMP phosphodiesterase response regulator RpfG [Peptococcaceae bacterium CEB3]